MIVNTELAKSKGHDQKDKWQTPIKIYNKLNLEFGFTLDPCCEDGKQLCPKYFTEVVDGLRQSWAGERVFMNPPYSRGNIDLWVEKGFRESSLALVVGLLPVSTSADWFMTT